MEVNRDEAERCIDIATAALTEDQPEKAQRFLEKAQRLFPTEKARGELRWPCRSKGLLQPGRQTVSSPAASPASRISCIPSDELCSAEAFDSRQASRDCAHTHKL